MEIQQEDLFPAELKNAALAVFGRPGASAILLKYSPEETIVECPPDSCTPVHTLLHDNERERLNNYRLNKRRAEFLAGRIAAKMALANLWSSLGLSLPAPLCHIEIASAASGRPYVASDALQGLQTPEISITHSGEYAAALAASLPCGIDIQQPRENLLRVRDKYCSLAELQLLAELYPETAPLARLSFLWTAKEAAKKALSYWQMVGFLELELVPSTMTHRQCHSCTLAIKVHDDACLPKFVTVLVTTFAGYGLAICILKQEDLRHA